MPTLTAQLRSSSPTMSSKGVGATCLDASGDTRQVTTTGPVPQIENIKLSGSQRELRVGCWDHVTRLPCITGFLTAGGEPRPPGLEFFSKWLLFATPPQVLGTWDQFHLSPHFPATELSAFSDCLKLWHEELLRWPHYSLLDVSEGVVPCGCLR